MLRLMCSNVIRAASLLLSATLLSVSLLVSLLLSVSLLLATLLSASLILTRHSHRLRRGSRGSHRLRRGSWDADECRCYWVRACDALDNSSKSFVIVLLQVGL